MKLWLDLETYSETPINHGTYRYAANAEIMLLAWALDEQPVQVWDLTTGGPIPFDLESALLDPEVLVYAHNSMFDRTVMRYAMPDLCPPIERWRDTMVQALCHSLPGALGNLCAVLGVPADKAKDKDGKRLIQLFCKPRPKTSKVLRATRDTHPADWAKFVAYAGDDIEAMREVERRLPKWTYPNSRELAMWHLDQHINDRGLAVDLDLAVAALQAVEDEKVVLAERTAGMTNGELASTTQRDAMLEYMLAEYGVQLPDMQGATLERRLDDPDIPEAMKDLLRIRLQASTTSTSKYKSLVRATNLDGRLRGLLQFAGASRTMRWSGRAWQPQNLARGTLKASEVEAGIAALKAGAAGLIYSNVMEVASSAIRGCIVATPGSKLVIADLSNIEGRMLAWLAGEEWKLQAFRDFDTMQLENGDWITGLAWTNAVLTGRTPKLALDKKGEPIRKGHDLYKLAYAKSFGVAPESVTKDQRQVGKVQELALGYASGVGGFATFAAAYGIDLDDLADKVLPVVDPELVREAEDFLEWRRKQPGATAFGMSDRAFIACETIKRGWRRGQPAIAGWWPVLEQAFRDAIDSPGHTFDCGSVKIRRDGNWMRIRLPSGRYLCYPSPAIDEQGRCSYMGMDQYTRKWQRIQTYSGKLAENCIAKGTEVLTPAGWVAIECVAHDAQVWDGEAWVPHAGVAAKGWKHVMRAFGVDMTPDHLILTTEGWKNASQSEGHNRAACRLPDSLAIPRERREAFAVGGAMRLRRREIDGPQRIQEAGRAGDTSVVRVQAARDHWRAQDNARHDQAPGLRGVAQHVGALLESTAQSVAALRRAGHRGLRQVAGVFRELLGRHGANVPEWAIAGPRGKQRGVHTVELPLGYRQGAGQQHTGERGGRGDHGGAAGRATWGETLDDVLPAFSGSARGAAGRCPRRFAQVFDLVNCGPRHRFVVRGADGQPLIVHNCTQASARDALAWNMPTLDAKGYRIVLSVHDELLTETPDTDEFSSDTLAAHMSNVPPWAEGLPLAAAGFETYRYKKE